MLRPMECFKVERARFSIGPKIFIIIISLVWRWRSEKWNEKWCAHSRCHRAYLKQTQLIIYARVRMARVESSRFCNDLLWMTGIFSLGMLIGRSGDSHKRAKLKRNEDRAIIMMFPNSSRHFFDVSRLTLMPVSWQQQQQPRNDDWKVVAKREKAISGRAEEKYANCAHDGC